MRKGILAAAWAFSAAPACWGASLDLSASYRMRGLSYTNLNLDSSRNNHSFVSNDARLGFAVRKIALESRGGEDSTMDVNVGLHAVGVAGATTTLASPFDRIAENYPNAAFVPFIENANLSVHQLLGLPVDATLGRQNFRLGSGLLLDDDGAGLTGVSGRIALPWWGLKLEGFTFAARGDMQGPNSLTLFGGSLVLPSEGTWQVNELMERDFRTQPELACFFPGVGPGGCLVSKTVRSFTSVRYQINYGPIYFDGEAAMERGTAVPTGPNPAPQRVAISGDAQVIKAKWKQDFYRMGEGIARVSLARGSGDDPGTPSKDEAFAPSHGHRFDGLERSGFGDFFGATPYDAFGGNYSTGSVSGLKGNGASGIIVVGGGITPPSFKGFTLDLDYFLFRADRVVTGSQTLGSEWDGKLYYTIEDRFRLSAAAAFFKVGSASNAGLGTARKYTLEASGRF